MKSFKEVLEKEELGKSGPKSPGLEVECPECERPALSSPVAEAVSRQTAEV